MESMKITQIPQLCDDIMHKESRLIPCTADCITI